MAQTSFIPHQNHKLFSDYYLDQILLKETILQNDAPGIEEAFRRIEGLYQKYKKEFLMLSEAQLERDFIQPVLEILGHVFEVQPTVPTPEGTKKPDYAFFEGDKIKSAARRNAGEKKFFQNALAIGDAKKWDRDLDRKAEKGKDPFSNLNPSYQIDYYLRVCDQTWGILTNGRQWRLYHRESSYSLDSYYQVNLEELLSKENLDAFRYFYLFFRKEAFLPLVKGESFLEWVRKESRSFTAGIEDDLKGRAYETIEKIMQGFLTHRLNRLKAEESKEEIKANSLILLYRLLFILFAESNRLLPMDKPSYAQKYSLEHLADEVLGELQRKIELDDDSTEYWDKLQRLFRWIDEGHDDPPIPQYNGGLFDPKTHKFLNENKIGDNSLAEIITALTVLQKEEQPIRVVYRDLGIQHLGSVYEGLLEFRPIVKNGKIVLESDKGERKVTGSYYTPDYIVRYIVENTLKPLVEQAKNHKDILNLKVLDPAMGSGHFLVGAVDFLAEQIVYHPDTELMAKGVEEKEIQYWRRRVVEQCIYGVDLNPMAVELAKLSLWIHTVAKGEALSFLDHHIRCGNSLFGARISDLSQLPALKKESKKAQAVRQSYIPLWEPIFIQQVKLAIGHYLIISETESHTADDVHKKAEMLRIGQEHLQLFRKAANVWLSSYFGNPVRGDEYQLVLDGLGKKSLDSVSHKVFFKKAEEISKGTKCFHWEIEFPEIFRDKHGRDKEGEAGFDAVIGNPPYGALFGVKEVTYFQNGFKVFKGVRDIYTCFIEKGVSILRSRGILSFIVPSAWVGGPDYKNLREFLLHYQIEKVILLPFDIFADAYIDTLIFAVSKSMSSPSAKAQTYSYGKRERIARIELSDKDYRLVHQDEWANTDDKKFILDPSTSHLIKKIRSGTSLTFDDVIEMKRGVLFDKKLLAKRKATKNSYPFFEGDVYRYQLNPVTENWVEFGDRMKERPKEFKWFEGSRILLRRLVNRKMRLMATLSTETFITNKNIYSILPKDKKYDSLSVLGILNSKLISYLYINQVTQATKDDFPQATIQDVLALPFPSRLNDETFQGKLQILVENILELNEKLSGAKKPDDKTRLERQIETTDRQIDQVVNELYGLTEEEIAVVEGKKT